MPKENKSPAQKTTDGLIDASAKKNIGLKDVAAALKLSPTTVSFVLNNSPLSDSIPQDTKDRIYEAARTLNYRPNYIARSLRNQRTHTVGILIPELSDGYSAAVLSGIEEVLIKEDYFSFVLSHHHRSDLIERNTQFLIERCVEGILAVDTPIYQQNFLPVVSVSGHEKIRGVTNITLNHELAAQLTFDHLRALGHRRAALIKGQDFSSDTEIRFAAMLEAARRVGIAVEDNWTAQLIGDDPSPETGYQAMTKLLPRIGEFSAVVCFNDMSAIGAIRALKEIKLKVPDDISVIGFDDIAAADFHNPSLTTIRQPLKDMGRTAAASLLDNVRQGIRDDSPQIITVKPSLIIRDSSGQCPQN